MLWMVECSLASVPVMGGASTQAGAREVAGCSWQKNKVGRPNTLIPKLSGNAHGTFPHIKGKFRIEF